MSERRSHMDCEPKYCLLGDPTPCLLFQPQFRRVVVTATPNSTYHGHTGDLIRYLSDLDGTINAEVRWDRPFPVAELSRQVMQLDYLTALDGEPLAPYVIQED